MPVDENEMQLQKELYIIVKNAKAVCLEHNEKSEKLLDKVEELCGTTLDRSGDLPKQLAMLMERIRIMYDTDKAGDFTQLDIFSRKSFCRMPQEAYEQAIPMMFEGVSMPVPVGWDAVLRAEYGDDYMTPIRGSMSHDYPFYKKQIKKIEERGNS